MPLVNQGDYKDTEMEMDKILLTVRVAASCSNEVDCLRNIIIGLEVDPRMTWAELFYQVSGTASTTFWNSSPFYISNVKRTFRFQLQQPISGIMEGYKYRMRVYIVYLMQADVTSGLRMKRKMKIADKPAGLEPLDDDDEVQLISESVNKSGLPGPRGRRVETPGQRGFKMPFPVSTSRLNMSTDSVICETPPCRFTPSSSTPTDHDSSSVSMQPFRANTSTITRLRRLRAKRLQECDNMSSCSGDQSTYSDVRHLTHENCKEKCSQSLQGISNTRLLIIHKELQQVFLSGKWVRTSSRIPLTANFLIDIFRINM